MDQGLIPRRYAKALLMLATERHTADAVYGAMQQLDAAFASEPQLQAGMTNPAVSNGDKLKLILTASGAEGAAATEMEGFVALLIRNRRLSFLRQCALAYVRLYREARRIFSVAITSAAPLQSEELRRIKTIVERQLPEGATAEYTEAVAPELIGGFIVSIDNEMLDASVANELKQLRLKLLSH